MGWILEIVKNPNRLEVYLILALSAVVAALVALYRDQRRQNRELMNLVKERAHGTTKLVEFLTDCLLQRCPAKAPPAPGAPDAAGSECNRDCP